MKIRSVKPVLDDERLKTMQVRASQVWRGEKQPTLQCAEDVLFLIQELRDCRLQLQKGKVFSENNEDSYEKELDKVAQELADAHSSMSRYSKWMSSLFKRNRRW
jgi:hypothetical protein